MYTGGLRVDPPSKIFTELVNVNAIKPQKVYPSPKDFSTLKYPPSLKLEKTSWTLPLDFQTVCIYVCCVPLNDVDLKLKLKINV
jgi:hypothetical protein